MVVSLTETSPIANNKSDFYEQQNLVVGEVLGTGNFGTVFKGKWKGKDVALKEFKDGSMEAAVVEEISILQLLNHPNIVQFYGVTKKIDGTILMAMELAPFGGLRDYMIANELPFETLKNVGLQIAQGMEYLHSKNIVHRDLGLRNVLLVAVVPLSVKIADFGLSQMLSSSKIYCKFEGAIPGTLSPCNSIYLSSLDVTRSVKDCQIHQRGKHIYALFI